MVNGDTEMQRKCLVLIPRAVPGHTGAPLSPSLTGTGTMWEGRVLLRAGRERASQKDRFGVEANFAEFYRPLPLEREVYGKQIELSSHNQVRQTDIGVDLCMYTCTLTSPKTAIALIFILALVQNTEHKTYIDTQK